MILYITIALLLQKYQQKCDKAPSNSKRKISRSFAVLHDENNEIHVELIVSITVKYSDGVGEFLKRNHQPISGLNTLVDARLQLLVKYCAKTVLVTYVCYCKK